MKVVFLRRFGFLFVSIIMIFGLFVLFFLVWVNSLFVVFKVRLVWVFFVVVFSWLVIFCLRVFLLWYFELVKVNGVLVFLLKVINLKWFLFGLGLNLFIRFFKNLVVFFRFFLLMLLDLLIINVMLSFVLYEGVVWLKRIERNCLINSKLSDI